MKSREQLVASIRELRFAIDRASAEVGDEELPPATRQALVAQLNALHGDIERLLEDLGEVSEAEAFERDLIAD